MRGLYRHVREIFSISLYQIQPISNGMIARIGMGYLIAFLIKRKYKVST